MDVLRQLITTAAAIGLLWGALRWIKRKGTISVQSSLSMRRERRDLESLERIFLSQQHSIHLVRFKDSQLVLGIHPTGISLLLDSTLETKEHTPQ